MYTEFCKQLGMEHGVFAFSHCRDVVAAVSNNGGMGVLGAGWMTPEQLQEELNWIDDHVGDNLYGVDIVIPQKYEGMDENDPVALEEKLWKMIPAQHVEFVQKLLADHGVPKWLDDSKSAGLAGWTYATALPLLEEALNHPKVKLIANALGTPPAEVVDMVQDSGRLIGALCGRVKQAIAHKEAGLDFVVAQGGEGGGHAGEISSIVLWPQIIDAVAPIPVIAAGGIGNGRQILAAMGMGAAGVWAGSLWLTVEEAEAQPAQKESYLKATSEDTIRSKSWTGKTARVLKNDWSEAWESDDAPEYLAMPLQGLVTSDAMRRTETYAGVANAQKVAMNPCGQVIGQINEVENCRGVINRLLTEYVDALEHVNAQLEG
jgi:NAD(P)H-dependent flavin oxidoreductase YrpB (nitropropane dioxygenase family)